MNAITTSSKQGDRIRPLLDYLSTREQPAREIWQDWQIAPIDGGHNNLIYRTTGPEGDLAIKFTIRDARDRAGREYGALLALRQAGLSIAPEPILLDRDSYRQPVVVQAWLQGESSAQVPSTDAEWERIVHHMALAHTITPERTAVPLAPGVLCVKSIESGKAIVQEQVARLPRTARPASLRALLQRFEHAHLSQWSDAPFALCHLDSNILNYIRRPGEWASVDWENAGWSDPAFEVADLTTHPAYIGVPQPRWEWVIQTYCDLVNDPTTPLRVRAYRQIMAVWWVARMARYLYEIPRGLDQRLARMPSDWPAGPEKKYAHYLTLAEMLGI